MSKRGEALGTQILIKHGDVMSLTYYHITNCCICRNFSTEQKLSILWYYKLNVIMWQQKSKR